jgi:hypothetical protein
MNKKKNPGIFLIALAFLGLVLLSGCMQGEDVNEGENISTQTELELGDYGGYRSSIDTHMILPVIPRV